MATVIGQYRHKLWVGRIVITLNMLLRMNLFVTDDSDRDGTKHKHGKYFIREKSAYRTERVELPG